MCSGDDIQQPWVKAATSQLSSNTLRHHANVTKVIISQWTYLESCPFYRLSHSLVRPPHTALSHCSCTMPITHPVKSFIQLTRTTILNYSKTNRKHTVYRRFGFIAEAFIRTDFRIKTRGATNWAMYGTSFYILTTGTGSQSWWRLPTWSRNIDKQYVSWLF